MTEPRLERCEATIRFEQRILRCTLPAGREHDDHEADVPAYGNRAGEPGLRSERVADLTLVWTLGELIDAPDPTGPLVKAEPL